jgi:integrase
VQRYAAQVGLGAVKPHDFRRFVGTELAKLNLHQAQRALGHQRLETTVAHYVLDELQPGLTEGLY